MSEDELGVVVFVGFVAGVSMILADSCALSPLHIALG